MRGVDNTSSQRPWQKPVPRETGIAGNAGGQHGSTDEGREEAI